MYQYIIIIISVVNVYLVGMYITRVSVDVYTLTDVCSRVLSKSSDLSRNTAGQDKQADHRPQVVKMRDCMSSLNFWIIR